MDEKQKQMNTVNKKIADFVRTLAPELPEEIFYIDLCIEYSRFPHIVIKTVDPNNQYKTITLMDGSIVKSLNIKQISVSLEPDE